MLKELFRIFENFTLENVPEEIKSDIKKEFNSDPSGYSNFLLSCLSFLNDLLTELNKNDKVLANSIIDYVLAFEFSAKSIKLMLEQEEEVIKITPSEKESIIINCSSILNAVETISELQAERLKKLNTEELLVALTT